MEESTVRIVLMAIGVITLGVSVWAAFTLVPAFESAVPSFLTPVLCAQANGAYVHAGPTSREVCSSLSGTGRNHNAQVCDSYPQSKRAACRQLMDALGERSSDCLGYVFSNETKYAQGAPQVAEYCRTLSAP